jgi:O-antigen ligase
MIVWMTLSALLNMKNAHTVSIIVDYVKWFVLYRLVIVTVGDLQRLKAVMLMVLFFGLLLAVEGVQHANHPEGLGWAGQGFGWMDDNAAAAGMRGRTRWINIFDGPGVFCVVYTISIPIAMQLAMRPFGIVVRLAAVGMVALLGIATYYTGSRGGFLATVGVAGLFVLARLRISLTRMMIAAGVVVAALVMAPDHLTSTRDSHGSAQHRIDMWYRGMQMLQDNPVFGVGKGNFVHYTGRLIAHNSGIEVFGETGIPGFLLWLGMLYMAFRNIFAGRAGTEDPFARAYLMALAISIAGYLMSAMFVTLEYETQYLLLALAAVAGRHAKTPLAFTRRDAFVVVGGALGFLLAVKMVVMLYY